ncbi:MAG: hypothetical protein AB7Q17_18200 [Phycisphaerae bacterium]
MAEKLVDVVIRARNELKPALDAAASQLDAFKKKAAAGGGVAGPGGGDLLGFGKAGVIAALSVAGLKTGLLALEATTKALRGEWEGVWDVAGRLPLGIGEIAKESRNLLDVWTGAKELAEHAAAMEKIWADGVRRRAAEAKSFADSTAKTIADLQKEVALATARTEADRERLQLAWKLNALAEEREKMQAKGADPALIRARAEAEAAAGVILGGQIDAREQEKAIADAAAAEKERIDAANRAAAAEARAADELAAKQSETQSLIADIVAARLEESGKAIEAQAARIIDRFRQLRERADTDQRALIDELERAELRKLRPESAGRDSPGQSGRFGVEAVVAGERFRGLAAAGAPDPLPRLIQIQTDELKDAIDRVREAVIEAMRQPAVRGFAL